MATKKQKDISLINTVSETAFMVATKTNDLALNATERAFNTSFAMTEKCIGLSSKVMKRGLQITSTQQDMFFDLLEGIKGKLVKK